MTAVSRPVPGTEPEGAGAAIDAPGVAGASNEAERALQGLRRRSDADAVLLALREGRELVAAGGYGIQRLGPEVRAALLAPGSVAHRVMTEGRAVLAGDGGEPLDAPQERALRGAHMRTMAALPLAGFTERRGTALLLFRAPDPRHASRLEAWADAATMVVHGMEYAELRWRHESDRRLAARIHADLERRVRRGEDRRRALIHILSDTNRFNRRLADQRKAMLHILGDYESDRRRLARQTERLDSSRRALLHILKDAHHSNQRLADSRKAMIHIMGDLHTTTLEVQHRENALRDKQEQLVQAGKLATLGELTTGVAHELNNPLNNIGLAIGNVMDLVELGRLDHDRIMRELGAAMQQVRKATEIITHLRTFGRAAPVLLELVPVNDVVERAAALLQEQLRLREIRLIKDLSAEGPMVLGNPIQLEQVTLNLIANARDALAGADRRDIVLSTAVRDHQVELIVEDSGPGIPEGLERRIFDPFFTTKDVGSGTGLGLSITYGILREHGGSIQVQNVPGRGARFEIRLPRALPATERRPQ